MSYEYLAHHGILGQKWGVRRFQNANGSYTAEGKKRHAKAESTISRAEAKRIKSEKVKNNVKSYQKAYNAASKASDKADANYRKVKEQYKSLGKNKIARIIASMKNETPEAKAYNKAFEKNMKEFDIADMKWSEAKAKYAETGKNKVSRVINNIKYDNKKPVIKETAKKVNNTMKEKQTARSKELLKDTINPNRNKKQPWNEKPKSPYREERDRQKKYLATKYVTNALLPGDAKAMKNMGLDYLYYKNSK